MTNNDKLYLMLDGIPFWMVKELKDEGYFPYMQEPKKTISTFPTLTGPAMSTIWGNLPFNSYESLNFDKSRNTYWADLRFFFGIDFGTSTYLDHFDMVYTDMEEVGGFAKYMFGLSQDTGVERELREFEEFVSTSDKPYKRCWFSAFDEIMHTHGLDAGKKQLKEFDSLVQDLRKKKRFDIVMYSDHGHCATANKFASLDKAIKKSHFRLSGKLKKENDVVLPHAAPLGFARLYSNESDREELADMMGYVEGVELVFYKKDSVYFVKRKYEQAEFMRFDTVVGRIYKYAPINGDPLDLGFEGFVRDQDLFESTQDRHYPDPLHRVANAFDNMRSPPDVLVSLDDNHMFGSRLLFNLYPVKTIHSNLNKDSSQAFIMSEQEVDMPDALRIDNIRKYIVI